MKTTFCVLFLLSAAAVWGQAPSANSAPAISSRRHQIQPASHPKHANSGSPSADGERPRREAMSPKAEVPLGDTARTLRKKHATAKKARTVLEN
jgi:hypothetical protein